MNQRVDFNTWWTEFLSEHRERDPRGDGHGAVDELRRFIDRLPPNEREEFVGELVGVACTRSPSSGLAMRGLEGACTSSAFARVVTRISQLERSADLTDQADVAALTRVLATSDDSEHRALLERYLLHRPIGVYWTSVPWALWPRDSALFGRSWARYFSVEPPATWRATAIVSAFSSGPEALACVRRILQGADRDAWIQLRDAVLAQVDSPWLDEDQRERLRFVCADAG